MKNIVELSRVQKTLTQMEDIHIGQSVAFAFVLFKSKTERPAVMFSLSNFVIESEL